MRAISSEGLKYGNVQRLNIFFNLDPYGVRDMCKMLRKDVRSLTLMLVLGDGCLHLTGTPRIYGGLTIDHGLGQADYQKWKAELLSKLFSKNVNVRTGHKGKSVQISITNNRFKSWRKFIYPNGKKDLSKILPFIRHPELALAVWFMDDGYCEPSFNTLSNGEKVMYGARLRLFTCDQNNQTQEKIIAWLKENFNIDAKILYQKVAKTKKVYPFIKLGQKDSLIVWEKIREFALQFKSMQHKFRYIEETYQKRILQRTTNES